MAEVKSNKKDQPMLDPIAYRADYSEENIIGPDSAEVVNTQKYQGEGTNNVYHPYSESLTTEKLDPDYQYWQPAKDINRVDDSYITRRNDQIASALYNEWKVTRDDVVNFLQGQKNWYNSTEQDRATTIENVWNRLGQISNDNQTEKEDSNKEVDTSRMESSLNKSTGWNIYWKTWADADWIIRWRDDPNTAYDVVNEARIAKVNALLSMGDNEIAASIISWTVPYWEQAMTDLQTYYPEKYASIMAKKKEIMTQMNVNAITSWGELTTSADTKDMTTQTVSYAVNNATLSVSATNLLKSIDSILESSDTAKSAKDLMWSIENDMAKLKNRLLNLRKEANTVFKWDVPDYIVNAYINNRTQEIQNQLSILEDRWNAANSRYDRELSHAEWQAEMDLKKDAQELEWYKAKNTTSSSSSATDKKYTVAEKNNNPTNMTVWFMQWAWAELWVDYEVSTDSFWSNWKQLYYAKLIWDPIQTTINVLNKAIAQGKNPFNTTSWSYINKLWLTVDKWNKMSQEEKEEAIRKRLPYEWWNMDNMAYYVNQKSMSEGNGGNGYFNPNYADIYSNFLQWKLYTEWRLNAAIVSVWAGDVEGLRSQANAWKNAQASNESAMNMLRAVEYLMSQWASKAQRQLAVNDWKTTRGIWDVWWRLDRSVFWDAANYNSYYHYIKDNMTLDHLVELKNNGATFWALSNQELDAIGNAALALSSDMGSYEFNSQLFTIYNKLRKNVWEKELSREEFNKMIWADSDKSNRWYYIVVYSDDANQSEDDKLSQIWTWSVSWWINFNDVITNWY